MFEREWQGKHDKFVRWCFEHLDVLAEFCRWFLPLEVLTQVDLSGIQVEKDSFIDNDLKTSFSDILATAPLKGGVGSARRVARIYLLIEHKSSSEPLSVFQVLKYMGTRGTKRQRKGIVSLLSHFPRDPASRAYAIQGTVGIPGTGCERLRNGRVRPAVPTETD